MNIVRSDAPAVWVLIFDRQPDDCEFNRMDLESTYFEQFLLQNVRSDIKANEVFGGEAAFSKLANAMTALSQTAGILRITSDSTNTPFNDHEDPQNMESSMRRSHIPLLGTHKLDWQNFTENDDASLRSTTVEKIFSASLVWIEASTATSPEPETVATTILNSICDRLLSYSGAEQKCPVLIVTFRSGEKFIVAEPLKSGISENHMHVPLWIRPNWGHACRVQALTGSFDLVPTIATFLGSSESTDEVRPPDVAQIADLSDRKVSSTYLTSDPQSLAFLCGAPQVCSNRVLKLEGDGWKAARTAEFLLVISDTSKPNAVKTESDGDSPEEPSRRLYVKPDDRFNVNDVSCTYSTVTEELFTVLQ